MVPTQRPLLDLAFGTAGGAPQKAPMRLCQSFYLCWFKIIQNLPPYSSKAHKTNISLFVLLGIQVYYDVHSRIMLHFQSTLEYYSRKTGISKH